MTLEGTALLERRQSRGSSPMVRSSAGPSPSLRPMLPPAAPLPAVALQTTPGPSSTSLGGVPASKAKDALAYLLDIAGDALPAETVAAVKRRAELPAAVHSKRVKMKPEQSAVNGATRRISSLQVRTHGLRQGPSSSTLQAAIYTAPPYKANAITAMSY